MAVLNKRTIEGLVLLAVWGEGGLPDVEHGVGHNVSETAKRDRLENIKRACEWIRQKQKDYEIGHRRVGR